MLNRTLIIFFLGILSLPAFAQQPAVADTSLAKRAYSKEDIDKLIKDNKIFFLEFTAVWCGPCKKMAPIIEEIEKENVGKIKVVRADFDVNRKLANIMNIFEIPYTQIYYDGKLLE